MSIFKFENGRGEREFKCVVSWSSVSGNLPVPNGLILRMRCSVLASGCILIATRPRGEQYSNSPGRKKMHCMSIPSFLIIQVLPLPGTPTRQIFIQLIASLYVHCWSVLPLVSSVSSAFRLSSKSRLHILPSTMGTAAFECVQWLYSFKCDCKNRFLVWKSP